MRNPVRSLQAKRFERSIRPWLDDLRRLAIRLTGSPDDAEDLLQDLLLRLHPRMEEVAALDQPRPWLARVLYRMFVDQWRRRRSGPELDHDAAVDEQAGLEDAPDAVFERGLTRQRLQAALDRLPAFQREIVLLHDVEGYTLTEVCTITDVPTGTLKSRLHRARLALRADLLQAGDMEPLEQELRDKRQEKVQ
ncbi:MAG: RNA polymerase sigma factor [Halofilum sp. (in: g-proteobacteria)]|nr:RNA polymerase sigma factor [Halofilum sp. (in: g-proteobacteria)]